MIKEPLFSKLFGNDFLVLASEIFLFIAITILLVFGVVYSTSKAKMTPVIIRNVSWLGLLSLGFAQILVLNSPVKKSIIFFNCLIIDDLSTLLKCLVYASAFICILSSLEYFKKERQNSFEHIILMLLSVLSMALMLSSYDFISMYLAIELQSLSFYVLAASKRDSEFSTEAGLKYFVLGAFSSGILLFGFSLVYGFTGLTNLEELAKLFSGPHEINAVSRLYNWEWESTGSMTGPSTLSISHAVPFSESNGFVLVGLLFLIVGFLFKVSAAPFHMWSPDVYEGSPLFVTAFFATAPKIAILGLFLRLLLFSFYDFLFFWQNITIVCAIISMAFACLAALAQKKIKRLLAFSSITHIGYILTALSCGTVEGLQSLLIYIFIYILMSLNFFSSLLSLRHSLGFNNDFKYISDFRLLSKTNALLALNITVSLFSMVGIPPLAGFWSKFYLFFSALSSSLYTAALIGVLSSVISCFFYIRIVKVMYFENLSTAPLGGSLLKKWVSYEPMDREKSLVIASTFFAILCIFMHLDILFLVTHRAVLNF